MKSELETKQFIRSIISDEILTNVVKIGQKQCPFCLECPEVFKLGDFHQHVKNCKNSEKESPPKENEPKKGDKLHYCIICNEFFRGSFQFHIENCKILESYVQTQNYSIHCKFCDTQWKTMSESGNFSTRIFDHLVKVHGIIPK